MLRNMKDLEGYAIGATDGTVGHVKDFYFDDVAWAIRYLVVDTGTWLSSRDVLISPIALRQPNWAEKVLPVAITREQVANSPDIGTEKTVSRQHEIQYLGHYGYSYYWGGAGLWGEGAYPSMLTTGEAPDKLAVDAMPPRAQSPEAEAEAAPQDDDPHLRSCNTVTSYHVQAIDGDIGHVAGFLVDDETWAIRYVVVDTSNWWLGHQVLIAPQWIDNVSWADATVSVNLTQQAVKDAPPYDAAAQLDREQELGLHEHYKRAGYWSPDAKSAPAISNRSAPADAAAR